MQRGVFHTELQHVRHTMLTLHNRLAEKATVYVKHTVPAGYTLAKLTTPNERLGEAYLFRVILEPNKKTDLTIDESTPVFTTTDIRSPEGTGLIRAYLSSAAVEGPLKKHVDDLLHLNTEMTNIEQRISSTRDQMAEYRTRMDELHASSRCKPQLTLSLSGNPEMFRAVFTITDREFENRSKESAKADSGVKGRTK